jgi:hypothetical protein
LLDLSRAQMAFSLKLTGRRILDRQHGQAAKNYPPQILCVYRPMT